jgi:hypothetical protein
MLFRKPWLAVAVLVVVLAALSIGASENPWITAITNLFQLGVLLVVLLRLGLLAGIAANMVILVFSVNYSVTSDPSKWYAPIAGLAIAILLALAVYAFRTSLAGKPLVGVRPSQG